MEPKRKRDRREYRKSRKEQDLIHNQIWRKNHPELCREYSKKWRAKNPDKIKEYKEINKINLSQLNREYEFKRKIKVIDYYSNGLMKCCCCGENNIFFLTVEHDYGNGNKHRKSIGGAIYRWLVKNNYPKGYSILCYNCNCSKGFFGVCAHKEIPRKFLKIYNLLCKNIIQIWE